MLRGTRTAFGDGLLGSERLGMRPVEPDPRDATVVEGFAGHLLGVCHSSTIRGRVAGPFAGRLELEHACTV